MHVLVYHWDLRIYESKKDPGRVRQERRDLLCILDNFADIHCFENFDLGSISWTISVMINEVDDEIWLKTFFRSTWEKNQSFDCISVNFRISAK